MVWRNNAMRAAKTAKAAFAAVPSVRASAVTARTVSTTAPRLATSVTTSTLEDKNSSVLSEDVVRQSAPYIVHTYKRPAPVLARGEGSYLYDLEGKSYLDLTSGIAVVALGYSDPEITRVLADQAGTLLHTSNLFYNPWAGTLSQLLVDATAHSGGMAHPDAAPAAVYIGNSGTEANEAAIKFARKVGKVRDPTGAKTEIVSFANAFHGRTMGALSATHNPKYQTPFAPMIPGFRCGTFNDADPAVLESLVTPSTCAVLVEPVQGEGGVHIATEEFMVALARRCRAVGALLIHDEIQCGLARTGGTLWAHAHLPSEAHPDMVTTAKALGNGVPIGAVITSRVVADTLQIGDHGSTFGGNPLACRVAAHVVARLADPALQADVLAKGAVLARGLQQLRDRFPDVITELRGRGLMVGAQLTCDPTPIINAARDRGLLIISCGTNALRFVPPLTISEAEIQEALQILEQAITATRTGAGGSA